MQLVLGTILFNCSNDPSKALIHKVKGILSVVEDYKYGDSRSWLQEYYEIMAEVYNEPAVHENVERLMIKLLNTKAAGEAKLLICKSLATIGSEVSIPSLEKLVTDPATSNMALIALTTIQANELDSTLIHMLSAVNDEVKMGIINTLALRKNLSAVDAIREFVKSENETLSYSAIQALGNIGGNEATQQLYNEFSLSEGDNKWRIGESLIKCLVDINHEKKADIYNSILDANAPLSLKFAAFKGVLNETNESEQIFLLLKTMKTAQQEFQMALIPLVRKLPAGTSLKPLISELSYFKEDVQIATMLAIADRKDVSIRPVLLRKMESQTLNHRIAALKGLKCVSNPEDIALLATLAANSTGKEQDLARECLYWMEGENVEQKIITKTGNSSNELVPELIKCLGYRKIEPALDLVFSFTNSNNPAIRLEAIKTLGKIGKHTDLERAIDQSFKDIKVIEAEAIERSLTSIALNTSDLNSSVRVINEKLSKFEDALSLTTLIAVLGNIGGDEALISIRSYLHDDNEDIQLTCIEAMSFWENDSVLSDLEKLIKTGLTAKNRAQTFAGIVTLVQNSDNLSEDQKSARIKAAYQFSKTDQDKKILINGISRIVSFDALDFAIAQLDAEINQKEVQECVIRIAGNLRYAHKETVAAKIDKLIKSSDSQEFIDKLIILKKSMQL